MTEPEVIESIKITTTVRSLVCHPLKLENPLEREPIEYTAKCLHPFVTVNHMPKSVAPLSHVNNYPHFILYLFALIYLWDCCKLQEYIYIQYLPILPSEESVILMVSGESLGEFPYELRLKATNAPPEKITRASAILGNSYKFSLPVENFTNENAKFAIQVCEI